MNKIYILKHKDFSIGIFSIQGNAVFNFAIYKTYKDKLPLPLKRILHYPEEFVEQELDKYYLANEDGNCLLDTWLSNRDIPLNRDNYDLYIKDKKNSLKYMLDNFGYSFDDCYWICDETGKTVWNDILKLRDKTDDYYSVKDQNGMYKNQNGTLGGQLEKFWYKSSGILKLCKKTRPTEEILSIRELIATLIYKNQKYNNYCAYEPVFNTDNQLIGTKCFCFTDTNTELITAYDLLEEYNYTQQDNVYELIISLAEKYGADTDEVRNYLDTQTLVDYIVTNRDRHQSNIGFLRNADTLTILKPAPIYDSGSCAYLEGEKPENELHTKINGLYSTEIECLSHVTNYEMVDYNALPTKTEIKKLLNLSQNMSADRKKTLLDLYAKKIEYLKNKCLHDK